MLEVLEDSRRETADVRVLRAVAGLHYARKENMTGSGTINEYLIHLPLP
jgi:hypothetical protein